MKKTIDTDVFADLRNVSDNSVAGETKMIDVSKIEPNRNNFYVISDVEILAESIENQGLLHNLVVAPKSDGGFYVISGHRRLEAIKLLLRENRRTSTLVQCVIITPKDDSDAMLLLILSNAASRVISDSEHIEQYKCLKSVFEKQKEEAKSNGGNFGRIREKIAQVLKISEGQVSRIERVEHNAIPEIKNAIKSGELSIAMASEMSRLDEDEQRNLIEKKPIKEISRKNIAEKVENKKVTNLVTNDKTGTDEDENKKVTNLVTSYKTITNDSDNIDDDESVLNSDDFDTLFDFDAEANVAGDFNAKSLAAEYIAHRSADFIMYCQQYKGLDLAAAQAFCDELINEQ